MITDAHLDAILDVWSKKGEKTTSILIGHSMAPLIRNGDTVVIEHGRNHMYIGDIVVFKKSHKICAHRLIGILNKRIRPKFLLKGDSCTAFDPLITDEQIIGKIIEVKGLNGALKFNSFFWRLSNYLLAQLSYLSGKCNAADVKLWETLSRLLSFSSKIVLKRKSYWNALLRIIAKAVRFKNKVQSSILSRTEE